MPKSTPHKRIAAFLTAAALIHLLALWLADRLLPPDLPQHSYQTARFRPFPIERFKPRPAIPLSSATLERLRAQGGPADTGDATAAPALSTPTVEAPVPDIPQPDLGQKPSLALERDTLALDSLWTTHPLDLPTVDPVLVDTERRRRTVAIIDPTSGKLKRAYLHLPVYTNAPLACRGCRGYQRGREVDEIYNFITRGAALPGRVPIETQIHWFKLGGCIRWPAPPLEGFGHPPDPIHSFGCRPQRHILHHTEMKEYSVLLTRYIDVESTQALAQYLIDGGFAVLDGNKWTLIGQALQERVGDRLESVTLELGHPLFHSYYDFTRYIPGNPLCPFGIQPLIALQLDGRVIALSGSIGFITEHNCPGNKFYVNAIAYALIQPSPMGGRYLSANRSSD